MLARRIPCPFGMAPSMTWLGIVTVLLGLAGCATTTLAAAEKDAGAKAFAPPEAEANLYVYRLSATAGAQKYVVSLDGRRLGESASGTFLHAVVTPGPHTILLSGKSQAALDFSAEAGANVFIKVDPRVSGWWWPAPTTIDLVEVSDQAAAMQDVRRCDLALGPQ